MEGIERELVSNTVDGPSAPIEEPIPTLSWPPEAFDNTSGEEDSLLSIGTASISMMNKSGKSVSNAFLFLSFFVIFNFCYTLLNKYLAAFRCRSNIK